MTNEFEDMNLASDSFNICCFTNSLFLENFDSNFFFSVFMSSYPNLSECALTQYFP